MCVCVCVCVCTQKDKVEERRGQTSNEPSEVNVKINGVKINGTHLHFESDSNNMVPL